MGSTKSKDSIAEYTYVVEYVEKLPSKKSYVTAQECEEAGLSYGKSRFANHLVAIKVLKNGTVTQPWPQ